MNATDDSPTAEAIPERHPHYDPADHGAYARVHVVLPDAPPDPPTAAAPEATDEHATKTPAETAVYAWIIARHRANDAARDAWNATAAENPDALPALATAFRLHGYFAPEV